MEIRPPDSDYQPDPILPMINVVFLLLIFFMLAGALHAIDVLDVEPPRSDSELPRAELESAVLIGADGRLAMGETEVDALALQLRVQDLLAARPDSVIRLKADGEVAAARVVEVMELLAAVGAERVMLLTLEPDPGGDR